MEILYFVPFFVIFLIALSMIIQGWMVIHENCGYRENPKVKNHPEMKNMKKGDGLMIVRFDSMEKSDYNELRKRILDINYNNED